MGKYTITVDDDDLAFGTTQDNAAHPDVVLMPEEYLQNVIDAHAHLWNIARFKVTLDVDEEMLVKTARDCLGNGKTFSLSVNPTTGVPEVTCT